MILDGIDASASRERCASPSSGTTPVSINYGVEGEMTEELKPCPFCKDTKIITPGSEFLCGHRDAMEIYGNSEDWNTRPIEDALRAQIEQLREEAKAAIEDASVWGCQKQPCGHPYACTEIDEDGATWCGWCSTEGRIEELEDQHAKDMAGVQSMIAQVKRLTIERDAALSELSAAKEFMARQRKDIDAARDENVLLREEYWRGYRAGIATARSLGVKDWLDCGCGARINATDNFSDPLHHARGCQYIAWLAEQEPR